MKLKHLISNVRTKTAAIVAAGLLAGGISASAQSKYANDAQKQKEAAEGVINRFMGSNPGVTVTVTINPALKDEKGKDKFSYSYSGSTLQVTASSAVAACRGFYDFVKSNNAGISSWSSKRFKKPESATVTTKEVTSPYRDHQYLNVVTYGYSMPYWDEDRWDEELDWMALHGIDMPLMLLASESIYRDVFSAKGLSKDELDAWEVGPAHLPWMRMGNLAGNSFDGPLGANWHKRQQEIAKHILERMAELNMKPIVPAFGGFVPKAYAQRYASGQYATTGWDWIRNNYPDYANYRITPAIDQFKEIGTAFVQRWDEVFESSYGNFQYYLSDSFNEMAVPDNTDELANYGNKIYNAIKDGSGNNDAVWVTQGWEFVYGRSKWNASKYQALRRDVPEHRFMSLYMAPEYGGYQWDYYNQFCGDDWNYTMLPNMGGKNFWTGNLNDYAKSYPQAVRNGRAWNNCTGWGMTMEGIEYNELLYELISDMGWTDPLQGPGVQDWMEKYGATRYGTDVYDDEFKALHTALRNTVYSQYRDHQNFGWQGNGKSSGYYNNGNIDRANDTFYAGFDRFFGENNMASLRQKAQNGGLGETLRADLLEFAAFYAAARVEKICARIKVANNMGKKQEANDLIEELRKVMYDMDFALTGHPLYDQAKWEAKAEKLAKTDPTETAHYVKNARRIVTTWFGNHGGHEAVNDYASRIYAGIIRDYYMPRLVAELDNLVNGNNNNLRQVELGFIPNGTNAAQAPALSVPKRVNSTTGELEAVPGGMTLQNTPDAALLDFVEKLVADSREAGTLQVAKEQIVPSTDSKTQWYVISSNYDNYRDRALTVTGNVNGKSAGVNMTTLTGTNTQYWRFIPTGDNTYRIESRDGQVLSYDSGFKTYKYNINSDTEVAYNQEQVIYAFKPATANNWMHYANGKNFELYKYVDNGTWLAGSTFTLATVDLTSDIVTETDYARYRSRLAGYNTWFPGEYGEAGLPKSADALSTTVSTFNKAQNAEALTSITNFFEDKWPTALKAAVNVPEGAKARLLFDLMLGALDLPANATDPETIEAFRTALHDAQEAIASGDEAACATQYTALQSAVKTYMNAVASFTYASPAPEANLFNENSKVITLKVGNGGYITTDATDENGNFKLTNTTKPNSTAGYWVVSGDDAHGYTFYNVGAGAKKVLGMSGNDGNARAKLYDASTVASQSGVIYAFSYRTNNNGAHVFYNGDNNAWNKRGDYLARWNDTKAFGTDPGSAFYVEEIQDVDLNPEVVENPTGSTSGDWTSSDWTAAAFGNKTEAAGKTNFYGACYYDYNSDITVTEASPVSATLTYVGGSHAQGIYGIQLIRKDEAAASNARSHRAPSAEGALDDYNFGTVGGNPKTQTYTVSSVPAGTYTLRVWSCATNGQETMTANGKLEVNVNDTKAGENNWNKDSWKIDNSLIPDKVKENTNIVKIGVTLNEGNGGTRNYRYLDKEMTFAEATTLTTTITSTDASKTMEIIGVELLKDGALVTSEGSYDGHYGTIGATNTDNTYTLAVPAAGTYTVRVWASYVKNQVASAGAAKYDVPQNNLPLAEVNGLWVAPSLTANGGFADNTVWYTIKNYQNVNGGVYNYMSTAVGYMNDDKTLKLSNRTPDTTNAGLWCLVGDATNGYKIYNKALGSAYVVSTSFTDNKGGMVLAEGATHDRFTFEQGKSAIDGWFIRDGVSGNQWWNQQGGFIKHWTSGKGDNNSTFVFEAVTPLPEVTPEFSYNVWSDGLPDGVEVFIKNEKVTPDGAWTVGGTYISNTSTLAAADVVLTGIGGGSVYSVNIDNANRQINIEVKDLFTPSTSTTENVHEYIIKDASNRYPYLKDNNNIWHTTEKATASRFLFIESGEKTGKYYIYDNTAKKYYIHTSNTGRTVSATSDSSVRLSDNLPSEAQGLWVFDIQGHIMPTEQANTANPFGWNFTGGNDHPLNLWETKDSNSAWQILDPTAVSLACAVTMYAEPGKEYMHKLIPEQGDVINSVEFGEGLTGLLDFYTDRLDKGHNYVYVKGTAPATPGVYTYTVKSDGGNAKVTLTVSDYLPAPTPTMGWLSWNWFESWAEEGVLLENARAMKKRGLVDAGYNYFILDDKWAVPVSRGATKANLTYDTEKFPSMTNFNNTMHDLGFRTGIYSDAGSTTCAGGYQPGSFGYEREHVAKFNEWGFDMVKYDFCNKEASARVSYPPMGKAISDINVLRKAANNPRPMALNICEWGQNQPWLWGAEAGGSTWRCTGDSREAWYCPPGSGRVGVLDGSDAMKDIWMYAGVNRFNDADMMMIGLHGCGSSSNNVPGHTNNAGGNLPNPLTVNQARSQMSIWSMFASPLTMCADFRDTPESRDNRQATLPNPLITKDDLFTLMNPNIIAINQDVLGQQAEFMERLSNPNGADGYDVYVKDLSGNRRALAVVNRSASATLASKSISFSDLYLDGTSYYVKDVWTGKVEQRTGTIETGTIEVSETKVYIISSEEMKEDDFSKFFEESAADEDTDNSLGAVDVDGSKYPFLLSTSADDMHWHYLIIRGNKYVSYNSQTTKFSNATTAPSGDAGLFAFVPVSENTVKIINKALGTSKAIGGTVTNNGIASVVDYANGLEFIYQNNDGHDVFAIKGAAANAHVNDIQNQLGFWVDGKSATDAGSTFTFAPTEVLISTDEVKHYYTIRNANPDGGRSTHYAHYVADNAKLALNATRDNSTVFYFTSAGENENGFQKVQIHNYTAEGLTMNGWNRWADTNPMTWYVRPATGTTDILMDFNIANTMTNIDSDNNTSWNHQSDGIANWHAGNDKGSAWYLEEVKERTYSISIVGADETDYTLYNNGEAYKNGDEITGFFFAANNFTTDPEGQHPFDGRLTTEGGTLVFSFDEYNTVNGGQRPADISEYALWYNEPATKTGVSDQWMEYALPMGNGQLGATIVGGVMTDKIQLNEKTLWSGGPGRNGSYGYFQNLGNIYVKNLSDAFTASSAVKPVNDYARYLDIMNGVAGVNFSSNNGSQYTRRYFTSMTDNVLVARYEVSGTDRLNLLFTYAPDALIGASAVTYTANEAYFNGGGNRNTAYVNYDSRFRVLSDGQVTRTDEGIKVENGTYATLLMATATDYDATKADVRSGVSKDELSQQVVARIEAAAGKDYADLLKAHTDKQQSYMGRVDFNVGGTSTKTTKELVDLYNTGNNKNTAEGLYLEQLYFQYGRYLTVGANADQSIHAPSNLQGIWNDRSNSSFWHCDVHADINVEMNYWPADPTNLSEMHLPFLEHIIDMATPDHWGTLTNGKPGWTIDCENNIFGGTSGWMNGGMKTLGAWYCSHLWRYYQYTKDKTFLKRALPAMYENALYLKAISVRDTDNKWVIPNEWSPEHGSNERGSTITAFAQQTTAEVCDEVIKAHKILGSDSPYSDADIKVIADYYNELDKGIQIENYTFTRNGQRYENVPCISEWKKYTLTDDGHRHLSHLMAIYPFEQISAYDETDEGKANFQAAKNGILARTGDVTGWSMGWQTNVYARTLEGDNARSYLSQALKHSRAYNIQMSNYGGCYYNLFDAHSPFQIDGNYGCTSGVAEMLLQSYDETIHLLPALPSAWNNGHAKGLKAVGNFTVDQTWAEGKLTGADITSHAGGPLRVHYGSKEAIIDNTLRGETYHFDIVDGKLNYNLVDASVVTIVDYINSGRGSAETLRNYEDIILRRR